MPAALYELARLNHYHDVPHTPEVEIIYNSLALGTQVHLFYQYALDVREKALGKNHPAYAQSLYGLATMYRDNGRTEEALAFLRSALTIQAGEADPLPTAMTLIALGDVFQLTKHSQDAMDSYQKAVSYLQYPSASLAALDKAAELLLRPDGVQEALEIQSRLADPYFKLTFELMADRGPELLTMVFELHRNQYTRDYRDSRIAALQNLAAVHRALGEPALAAPLLQEVINLQTENA